MQNNFNATFYEKVGAHWGTKTWPSSEFNRNIHVLLFLQYPPWFWIAVEGYGNLTTPLIPGGITVLNYPFLRFDVGGVPLIDPSEIPEMGRQSNGPTVTNTVEVRGYYGKIDIPGRDWENGSNPAEYSLRTFGQGPGATVQTQGFVGRAADGIYRAAIIPESEYTQQIKDDGNHFTVAGPTIYSVAGIYSG